MHDITWLQLKSHTKNQSFSIQIQQLVQKYRNIISSSLRHKEHVHLTEVVWVRSRSSPRKICTGQCGTGTRCFWGSSVSFCHYHSNTSPYSITSPPRTLHYILATDSFKFMNNIFHFSWRSKIYFRRFFSITDNTRGLVVTQNID
jgi:hypothetical protein